MAGFGALNRCTTEVLAFGFKDAAPPRVPPAPPADLDALAERALTAFRRSGRERLALLGLGSGALAGELAAALPDGAFCVCELDPALARALGDAGRLSWWRSDAPQGLAADASPWALFALLARAGAGPGQALALPNPELAPAAKAAHRPLELLLARSAPLAAIAGAPVPRLTAAAILAPDEPDLPEYFAQFPDWLTELVLVWDAGRPPEAVIAGLPLPSAFPVRHIARPLAGDFSAQRNAMLAACGGDWVLYLDADERLSPDAWAALPGLCAEARAEAWHFPRLTPYPDASRVLTGFGLWPDIQLRLFRNRPSLRFVNPVHERLTGLSGGQALALDVEIEHLGRLRKDAEAIRRKLAGFDAAGGGSVRHALSAEYPSVPRGLLSAAALGGLPVRLLLPPEAG